MSGEWQWKLTIEKGGPGSGNWGHAGRPGMVGGSASGGGGGKGARAVAQAILSEARKVEPKVTQTVTGTVAANGGEMYGLDYRLKGEDSLARKIRSMARETGMSPEEVGQTQIRDAVRYTALFDSENYLQGTRAVQQSLAAQGWKKYDHQFKNYWRPGDAYDGYNCVFVNDKGFKMEVQFHTPQSIQVKERSWKLYEKARKLPAGPEYSRLTLQMTELWGRVSRPAGWQDLPGRQM